MLDVPHPAPGEFRSSAEPLSMVPGLPVLPPSRDRHSGDLLEGLLDDGEDTLSLVLDGVVDIRLEAQLTALLDSIRSSGVRHIVLEMATVTSMDAAGLRFLSAVRDLAEERAGTVRLADPTHAVLGLVTDAGLDDMPGTRLL